MDIKESQELLLQIVQGISGEEENEWSGDLFYDDLREHGLEDLQDKFGLQEHDTRALYMNIKYLSDFPRDVYRLDAKDEVVARAFLENLQEDIHGNFYGEWSEYQRCILKAWLADLAEGTRLELESKGEHNPWKPVVGTRVKK